ncbi:MAG: hypothetical protein JXN63_04735 [Candidatus Delongbacteria bacterium]|nr:hypothetical protein [Candidatus Delongbacteria bacterium]
MNKRVEFFQKGSCFYAKCIRIDSETYGDVKEFCREKIISGYDPGSGIVIDSADEIRYLTIGGVSSNFFPLEYGKNCSYMLEF